MKINNPKLKKLIQESNDNPFISAFIIQAVDRYANEVLADKEETKRQMANSIVSPLLWISVAEEIKSIVGE
jgi:malonyl CoA-acyl carrier protein transacylase